MDKTAPGRDVDSSFERMTANAHSAIIETFTAARPPIAERIAQGRALRQKVPRNAHATLGTEIDRPDPVDILEQQNRTRMQKLVPVRHARMLGRWNWALTLPQVAATLAATLVAYHTVDAAGQRLLDEKMLNAVLVLMLATSVLGPVLTERFAPRMLEGEARPAKAAG